jgi:hypothetical protein
MAPPLADFDLANAVAVLARTPATMTTLLRDLPSPWTDGDEGPETWSPTVVIGHLNHGERTDWIPRARMILEQGEAQAFEPFDRVAQFTESRGKTLGTLLDEFAELRTANLRTLADWNLSPGDLARTGTHPEFGRVTLAQLLATWVVHDLDHMVQIARVMAKQLDVAVGPWKAYLSVLGDRIR